MLMAHGSGKRINSLKQACRPAVGVGWRGAGRPSHDLPLWSQIQYEPQGNQVRSWAFGPDRPKSLELKNLVSYFQVKEPLIHYLILMNLCFSNCKMDIILPAFQRSNICNIRVCVMPGTMGTL